MTTRKSYPGQKTAQKESDYVNAHPGTSEVKRETAPSHLQTRPKCVSAKELPKGVLEVDFLLPNGLYLNITVPFRSTMANLKKIVWHRAYKEPLFNLLDHPSHYTFMCVDLNSYHQNLEDHHRLCEVDFFLPIYVPRENKQPKSLPSSEMKLLLDRDMKALKNPEVDMFWYRVKQLYETIMETQQALPVKEWLDVTYPPQLDRFAKAESSLKVVVNIQGSQENQTINFNPTRYPIDLIRWTLQSRPSTSSRLAKPRPEAFVLKVMGMEDYLHGEHSLFEFKYISECMRYGITPHLTITPLAFVTHRHKIRAPRSRLSLLRVYPNLEDAAVMIKSFPDPALLIPAFLSILSNGRSVDRTLSSILSFLKDMVISGQTSLWDLKQPFMIQIIEGSNVTIAEGCKVVVRAGLIHGHNSLCPDVETKEVNASSHPVWQQKLGFDIRVCDLPRMTRLCLSLCSVHRVFVTRRKVTPIAWVNMMVFDHSDTLNSGRQSMTLWCPFPDTIEDSLNPTGSVGCNPDVNGTTLKVIVLHESPDPVYYPSIEEIMEFGKSNTAKKVMFEEVEKLEEHGTAGSFSPEEAGTRHHDHFALYALVKIKLTRYLQEVRVGQYFSFYIPDWMKSAPVRAHQDTEQELQAILYKNCQEELTDHEKDLIWKYRLEIQKCHPESLAKLLLSTQWSCHVRATQMIYLLQSWSEISFSSALELLGSRFPDPQVEMFAVRCLRRLSDEELSSLLLQFAQVLKTKAYLYNEVSAFLLERAFMRRRIGHQLFWLLRSEMNETPQFSIILEIYCSTNFFQHVDLIKQVRAINRIKGLNNFIKTNSMRREEVMVAFLERLRAERHSGNLSYLCCPVDTGVVLKDLCVERCSFMQSKNKPLLLIYNTDVHGGSQFGIIFKRGDDLRQDILVLNMIKMMDRLWKDEGLDLRMISYGCVSTAPQMGLIEAVLKSETIASIHRGRRAMTAAFNKDAIFNWLRNKNPGESLQQALEEFTLSCAGYCVATYVLGIGDRHDDNIMVRETGQLFHVDYGHILGKFKTKFGVKREHPPFVLTSDFLHVIQHGRADDEFKFHRFRCLCEKAYSVVRENRTLFLNMVSLMDGAGLSEPNSSLVIQYMKDSLGVQLSDEEALQNFRMKFEAAIRNSWKAKLNCWAHNLSTDNR